MDEGKPIPRPAKMFAMTFQEPIRGIELDGETILILFDSGVSRVRYPKETVE